MEEELGDIILVSVHLIHNAGILKRERFSKAPALGHPLLSCGEKAFAMCRYQPHRSRVDKQNQQREVEARTGLTEMALKLESV